ncbi:MAG: rhomboid family intramembrane serine protease [Azospirillum sp.]|nr:rhomboid family intramembrane serine protease [Azospirillum sp.]
MGFVLGGGNPLLRIRAPFVNQGLITVCVVAFVLSVLPRGALHVDDYAFVPALLFGDWTVAAVAGGLPVPATLFSHLFLHGDPLHLLGNMVALWVFGSNVEDAMGHFRYLAFYLLTGLAGAVAEACLGSSPLTPMIGSSAAISGVMGAYLLLHPHAKILCLLFYRIPVLLPASLVVLADVLFNLMMVFRPLSADYTIVAWWAHLGGFAAGLLLTVPFKHATVPLFHPPSAYPDEPFPRLQRLLLVDFFPAGDGVAASLRRKTVILFKSLLYFGLIAALWQTL